MAARWSRGTPSVLPCSGMPSEGMEKGFLAMMLDAEGAQVLMIGAMDGLSLQDAACCIALRTNGHLRHHDVRVGFGGEVA